MSLFFQNFGRTQDPRRKPSGAEIRTAILCLSALILPGLLPAQTGQPANKPILSGTPESAPAAPAAPAPQLEQPVSTPIDANTYIIGARDQLQVTVWKEPTLSGSFSVRPDGMISLILVGDLRAAGLTPLQLGKNITAQLEKFVQNPMVTVSVVGVNSQHIYMVGEIGHVGPVDLTPGMTPLQAIATAGGLSPYANGKKIYILRGPQGKQIKIPFNYKAALKGDNQQNVSLLPGDTIVVP